MGGEPEALSIGAGIAGIAEIPLKESMNLPSRQFPQFPQFPQGGNERRPHLMTLLLDPIEREELRIAAIARFVERQIGEQAFRLELARCGLTATEIDQLVNDHRRERRRGTPFE
jgi:hypothetical protein